MFIKLIKQLSQSNQNTLHFTMAENLIKEMLNKFKDLEIVLTKPHTTKSLAERYKKIIDWERFFRIVNQLGNQCNSRKNRFDKADILEQALEVCSNGILSWIDEIGRDHRDNKLNIEIEFKFQISSMFTKVRKNPKKFIKIRIKNFIGKKKTTAAGAAASASGAARKTKIDNPADYYLFVQNDAVGIISYKEMEPYLVEKRDGMDTAIPHNKITYIIKPTKQEFKPIPNAMNYKKRKREMQREFIMSVPPSKKKLCTK